MARLAFLFAPTAIATTQVYQTQKMSLADVAAETILALMGGARADNTGYVGNANNSSQGSLCAR